MKNTTHNTITPLKFSTKYKGGEKELQDKVEELTNFINEVLIPVINNQQYEIDNLKQDFMEDEALTS